VKPRRVIRPQAERDIKEQSRCIGHRSRQIAVRFVRAVRAIIDELSARPEMSAIWHSPQSRLTGVRVWQVQGFKNHLIFYRITERSVEFLGVLPGARDLPRVLEDEPRAEDPRGMDE
jgi:toxin ParE1/3/4